MPACCQRLADPSSEYLHGVPLYSWFCTLERGHGGDHAVPQCSGWNQLDPKPQPITLTPEQIAGMWNMER